MAGMAGSSGKKPFWTPKNKKCRRRRGGLQIDRHMFCPLQQCLEDIPVLKVNLLASYLYYLSILEILSVREKNIAPVFIGARGSRQVPTTPFANPVSEFSSFHILRLYLSPDQPEQVDLLIRDEDLYFVAFRSTEDRVNWTEWFCFKHVVLPHFLPSKEINMTFDYSSSDLCTPGGSILCLSTMFFNLASFHMHEQVTEDFQIAVFSVISLFCEARRFRSVQNLMASRIGNRIKAQTLAASHWTRVQDRRSFGTAMVTVTKAGEIRLDAQLDQWIRDAHPNLSTVGHLLGDEGELLLIRLRQVDLGWTDEEFNEAREAKGAGTAADPSFVIPPAGDSPAPHPGHGN